MVLTASACSGKNTQQSSFSEEKNSSAVSTETSETSSAADAEADEAEEKDCITIKVGVVTDEYAPYAEYFNNNSNTCHVELVNYAEGLTEKDSYYTTSNGKTTPEVNMEREIIAGNSPDMFILPHCQLISELADSGAFADMYGFIDNDSVLDRDSFMPNVLAALETDGSLYMLSDYFSVDTLIAKKSAVSVSDWTFDDIKALHSSLPQGTDLFQDAFAKSDVFDLLSQGCIFSEIDKAAKSCSFDSQSYIDFLEFCGSFPDENLDTRNMDDEQIMEYYNRRMTAISRDEALVTQTGFASVHDFRLWRYCLAGGELSFPGYPTNDGHGTMICFGNYFAVSSSSDKKDTAWEFIKGLLDTELYNETHGFEQGTERSNGLPVYEAEFDECVKSGMQEAFKWRLDENNVFDVPPLSQEDADAFTDMVKKAVAIEDRNISDVYSICREEAEAYFAGERSAADAAALTQSRIQLMFDEKG